MNLCEEIGRPIVLPAVVMIDNQPVIDLVSSPHSKTKRCRHFLMLCKWVRAHVVYGNLELRTVPAIEDRVRELYEEEYGNRVLY